MQLRDLQLLYSCLMGEEKQFQRPTGKGQIAMSLSKLFFLLHSSSVDLLHLDDKLCIGDSLEFTERAHTILLCRNQSVFTIV